MTTTDMYKAIYQTLKAGPLASYPVQQANLPRPAAATTWAVITNDGSSIIGDSDPHRARQYFGVWLYMKTDEETNLTTLAAAVYDAIHEKLISGTGTGKVRFTCMSISPVWWAEEYGCRAVDLTFRTLTTKI